MLQAEGASGGEAMRSDGLGTFQKQNLGWCGKSLQEKSYRAGGEIREAGRGLTMADFFGRIRSLVLTPKAIEATGGF